MLQDPLQMHAACWQSGVGKKPLKSSEVNSSHTSQFPLHTYLHSALIWINRLTIWVYYTPKSQHQTSYSHLHSFTKQNRLQMQRVEHFCSLDLSREMNLFSCAQNPLLPAKEKPWCNLTIRGYKKSHYLGKEVTGEEKEHLWMVAYKLGRQLESLHVWDIHGSHSTILARLQQLISPEGFYDALKVQATNSGRLP